MRCKILWIFLYLCVFLNAKTPELLLLEKYKDQNISGFLMSEKLDGIRAYWNGKELLTRNGNKIFAPQWFVEDLPPFELDGELWSKRGDFENIQSIVLDEKPSEKWQQISYNIFEVPQQKGTLLQRFKILEDYLQKKQIPHLKLISHFACKDKEHLHSFLNEVLSKGGEGVVLRDPNASYIAKRTQKALKVKTFDDDECKIIAHHKGEGKYSDLLGSFTCELKNGIRFKIGSGLSDNDRKNPPKIGEIVTFKYQGLTKNKKPRFPVYLRKRMD